MTRVVNKHLLDVFDEPMVYFPLRAWSRPGVTDVVLVTGQEIDQFRQLLVTDRARRQHHLRGAGGRGRDRGSLAQAGPQLEGEDAVVILGDNIFQDDLTPYVTAFQQQGGGARTPLEAGGLPHDARRFGVATVRGEQIIEIEEKPGRPQSDLVVTGATCTPLRCSSIIAGLEPAAGELEITDVNNTDIRAGTTKVDIPQGAGGRMPGRVLRAS